MAPQPAATGGFPPIEGENASLLILGSLPGDASVRAGQYYAHPRNAFWPIMERLFNIPRDSSPATRQAGLIREQIALWDVLAACERPGSLDSAIRRETEIANDFGHFFRQQPAIRRILFNGQTAATLFRRHALGQWPQLGELEFRTLPSTSPANAQRTFEEKLSAWAAALRAE